MPAGKEMPTPERIDGPDKGTDDYPPRAVVTDTDPLTRHGDPAEAKGEAGAYDKLIEEMGLKPESFQTMDEKKAATNCASEQEAKDKLKKLQASEKSEPARSGATSTTEKR